MIEQAIRYILVNDTTVKAITTRCYPVKLPQSPVYPLMLYHAVGGIEEHALGGTTGKSRSRMQVEAWSNVSALEAKTLMKAISGALIDYVGTVAGVVIKSITAESRPISGYEAGVEAYRYHRDFMIWHTE
ncbi:MAG: DUF3168 domain-containing protein [Bacteroidales bacterium]|jgi:hypothetical protein